METTGRRERTGSMSQQSLRYDAVSGLSAVAAVFSTLDFPGIMQGAANQI